MASRSPEIISHDHIKRRRLTQLTVPCCGGAHVGEFVPFMFCTRSPMLYTINRGNTGRPAGCQSTIIYLVSSVAACIGTGHRWAISSGNAGAFHTTFSSDVAALDALDWAAIRATDWKGKPHQKSAEFLLADHFPWSATKEIGCQNQSVVNDVLALVATAAHSPPVSIQRSWYY